MIDPTLHGYHIAFLRPTLARPSSDMFAFSRVPDAFVTMREGRHFGKIVVAVEQPGGSPDKRVHARPWPAKPGVNALEDALWRNPGHRVACRATPDCLRATWAASAPGLPA
jgi:hypothetical protein